MFSLAYLVPEACYLIEPLMSRLSVREHPVWQMAETPQILRPGKHTDGPAGQHCDVVSSVPVGVSGTDDPGARPDYRNRSAPLSALRRRTAHIADHATLPAILLLSTFSLVAYFELLHHLIAGIALAVLLAIFVAATLSSIAGFAFSALSGALLFHLLGGPVHIVKIMIVCSIAIQFFSVVTLRNTISWQYLSRFMLGGVIGLPLGIYLLTHIAPSSYMKIMGIFLVLYGIYMIFRRPFLINKAHAITDVGAGFLGGITGGFAGFPGAFVTIWCGLKGWTKDQQRGVYQPFILIMQLLALASIMSVQSSASHATGIDFSALEYVPAALLGTWCGISIFRRLTEMQFARSVNILLVVSGLGLLS